MESPLSILDRPERLPVPIKEPSSSGRLNSKSSVFDSTFMDFLTLDVLSSRKYKLRQLLFLLIIVFVWTINYDQRATLNAAELDEKQLFLQEVKKNWGDSKSIIEIWALDGLQVTMLNPVALSSKFAAMQVSNKVTMEEMENRLLELPLHQHIRVKDVTRSHDNALFEIRALLRKAQKCGQKTAKTSTGKYIAATCLFLQFTGENGLREQLINLFPQNLLQDYSIYQNDQHITKNVPNDGLIINVAALHFTPALINRVLTGNGRLLYGPKIVSNHYPLGGYAHTPQKARQMIKSLGSKKPLLVQAQGVRKGTDIIISNNDTELIYSADQNTGFLEIGRVVFQLQ